MRARVLIVDDEPEQCRWLEADLARRGYDIQWSTALEDAYRTLSAERFDAVVADLQLRHGTGLDLCARLKAESPDLPVIIVTAFGSLETAIGAIRAGAYDFVTKPLEVDELALTLQRAVDHRQFREEVQRLRSAVKESQSFEDMLGSSPPMQELFELIRRVADSTASVLISGESGTGKEWVARAIHRQSPRREGPFVALNCAAVPETLLENELFGHTRGAFTDARQERAGLFVQADGGTLFLDEISDLARGVQPKLLRVLQERKVRPLGSAAETPFDIRLIAATNRNLEEEVRAGRFREDLFFRVQVVHVEVPPLRDRGNDVLLLAQHFLDHFALRSGRRVLGLSSAAARKLRDYPWPGNVRELQNCLERAVALTPRGEVEVEDLPDRIRNHRGAPPLPNRGAVSGLVSLEEVERTHILRVLEALDGNKSQAARILGLDRKTLYRKLEGYGVPIHEVGQGGR